jgi:hypothetical protein
MNKKETTKGNVTIECGTNLAIANDNDKLQENYLEFLV